MEGSIKRHLDALFFSQSYALERCAILRVLTVGIALMMLVTGPYDTAYHSDAAGIMYREKFPFFFVSGFVEVFAPVKQLTLVLGIFAALGLWTRYSLPAFTIGYSFLNFLIHCYQSHYCMNQAHLNFILFALCFARSNDFLAIDAKVFDRGAATKKERDFASWVLTFSGAFIAVLLFQTGLSKLIYGGLAWFTSGDTLYVEIILDGTDFGRRLTSMEGVFPVIGIAVGVFELGFPWLFLWKKYHVLLGSVLLLFHFSTFVIMGISFWFLWPLYFPLFLCKEEVAEYIRARSEPLAEGEHA
jgi:hypothetical protein